MKQVKSVSTLLQVQILFIVLLTQNLKGWSDRHSSAPSKVRNLAVAHDTKTIAMASKRDSSSMKMLAAVTTIFPPGAFVATLFSMNMFNWFASDGTPVVSPRFWMYWSVTIPLTLITVGSWLGWEFWAIREQKKRSQSLKAEDAAGVDKNIC